MKNNQLINSNDLLRGDNTSVTWNMQPILEQD